MGILLSILRAPGWLKLTGAAVIVLSVIQVRHALEVRGLNRQIAALTSDLATEHQARADVTAALAEVQVNRDQLALEVRRQNDAIAAHVTRAERAEAVAALRATRLLEQGRQLAEALRRDTGPVRVPPGHAAINAWLAERLP